MFIAKHRRLMLKRVFNLINARRSKAVARMNTINERPIEYGFALEVLSTIAVRSIADIGSGETAFPGVLEDCGYQVTATDNIHDYWPQGMFNRHCVVTDDNILQSRLATDRYDCVTCISVLEHIPEYARAVSNMARILKPGGHLIMTFPYNEDDYVPNVYKRPDSGYGQDNPYICQVFSRREIDAWVRSNPLTICRQDYWQVFDGMYWTCGKPIYPRIRTRRTEAHQLTCMHFCKQP